MSYLLSFLIPTLPKLVQSIPILREEVFYFSVLLACFITVRLKIIKSTEKRLVLPQEPFVLMVLEVIFVLLWSSFCCCGKRLYFDSIDGDWSTIYLHKVYSDRTIITSKIQLVHFQKNWNCKVRFVCFIIVQCRLTIFYQKYKKSLITELVSFCQNISVI